MITYNIGDVQSVAMLPYLAAETRLANPHATFMLHECNWTFGNGPVGRTALRDALQSLDIDSERYCEIFRERMQKGFDIGSRLRGKTSILTATEALDAGIATIPAPDGMTFPTGTT